MQPSSERVPAFHGKADANFLTVGCEKLHAFICNILKQNVCLIRVEISSSAFFNSYISDCGAIVSKLSLK